MKPVPLTFIQEGLNIVNIIIIIIIMAFKTINSINNNKKHIGAKTSDMSYGTQIRYEQVM